MGELWRLSAVALIEGYRLRHFTPVDALSECLARLSAWQPHTRSMSFTDPAGALQAAQASARRWARGRPLGPLDGVPLTLKDNLHAAGLPTTWGSRLLAGFVPSQDELPVARLRAAGAVILGKTNLPEFAMQGYTSNAVTGTTCNPWDLRLTPGGSSGGAGAAVACGGGPLALATDGGGSIRRPASHLGLVGYKPSAGRVPRGGGTPEIFLDYEVAGAIGRTVTDVAVLIDAIGGAAGRSSPGAAAPLRVLYVPRFGAHPVDPGIAASVRHAAGQFEGLGHRVEQADGFELAEEVNACWATLSCTGLAWMLDTPGRWPEFRGAIPDVSACTPAAQDNLRQGRAEGSAALFGVLAAVHTLRAGLRALFERYDVLLTPATAALPWPAAQTHPDQIDGQAVGPRGHAVFTAFANAGGLPAVALPCGFVDGLPVGFQLVGAPETDAGLLALARRYEAACPWAAAWPELPAAPAARPRS